MSINLGFDTITKQYLKNLVFGGVKVSREWTDYYVNVSTSYSYPHGIANFPCSVRDDKITENTNLTVKTITFDDVPLATLNLNTVDVRVRFVKPNKIVTTKDLTSVDLSSKFSATMIKDKSTNVFCFVVDESFNVGDAAGSALFQMGIKFGSNIGSNTPEVAVVYAVE